MMNFLFSILLVLNAFTAHDYHVSVCEVVYNSQNQSLEVIQSVIVDDFEKTLKKAFKKKKIDLLSEEQFEENGILIQSYFEENLILFQNEQQLKSTWIGHEIDDTNLTAFIEFENISKTEAIKLQSTLMTERFRKQQNMVHWKFGEDFKTSVLNRKNILVELIP